MKFCKILLFVILISFITTSCEKSKDTQIKEFITQYYKSFGKLSYTNPNISSTSAEKTGENEITIRFYITPIEDSLASKIFKESLPEMVGLAFSEERMTSKLANKGITFKVRVLNDAGQKLFLSRSYNKSSFDSIKANFAKIQSPNHDDLDDLRKYVYVLKQKLPLKNTEKGITLVNIDINSNKNLIYTARVNDDRLEVGDISKKNLLEDKKLSPLFKRALTKGIRHIIYRFEDNNGNTLKDIIIESRDFY